MKSKAFILLLIVCVLSGCGGDEKNAGNFVPVEGETGPMPGAGSSIPTLAQPKKISIDSEADALDPHLVVDRRGSSTVTAVWRQYDGVRHNLLSSKYTEGNNFWLPQPVFLEASEGDVRDVDIVVDDNGGVTVVWTQNMGNHYGLWANFYDWNTSRWRQPVLIEDATVTGDAGSILLTVDDSRRVTVVWTQAGSTADEQLWINHLHPNDGADGAWRGATQVSDRVNGDVSLAKMVVGRFGAVMLLWTQANAAGTYVDLWARRYTPPTGGRGWTIGLAQRLDSEDNGNAINPTAVIDFSGNYTVVWGQYDGNRRDLWTARYDGSAWDAAIKLETQDQGSVDEPQLFIDSMDVITAVWLQSDGMVDQAWARRYENGAWATAQTLGNGAGDVSGLNAEGGGGGRLVVTWLQSNAARDDLWANYFDGSDWGVAQLIEGTDSASAAVPLLFLDRSGNASAIWRQRGPSRIDLWANRYSVGSGWATAVKLEGWDDGDVISAPTGVMDSGGKVTLLWRQHRESADHLLISQYNLASDRWNDPNKVAETQAEGSYAPQLALDSADDITVIWSQPINGHVELWGNRL